MDEQTRSDLAARLRDALIELTRLKERLATTEEDDYNTLGPCERAIACVGDALRLIGQDSG